MWSLKVPEAAGTGREVFGGGCGTWNEVDRVGCWPGGSQDRQRRGTWQLGLMGDKEAELLEQQGWRHLSHFGLVGCEPLGLLLVLCPPAL